MACDEKRNAIAERHDEATARTTPGPWRWQHKSGSLHRVGTPPYEFGEVVLEPTYEYDAGTDCKVSEPDARLLEAAPLLLAALQAIERGDEHPRDIARRAIAAGNLEES